jgi:O-antigen/teichoic acid export membrane protein
MGLIQKQTLKGTLYTYMGVLVGFMTSGILFPRILSPNEIGLINLLVAFSVIFMQVASLGFNSVIGRLFPYFRNSHTGHNGFLVIAIAVSITGLTISFIAFGLMRPSLLENNQENSELLLSYIDYIIPLVVFTLIFNLFDSYNKALYDAVLGTMLKEMAQRIFIIIVLLFYYFNIVTVHQFFQLYVVALSMPAVILLLVLVKRGEFRLVPVNREVFTKRMVKEMLQLSLFGFVSGLSIFVVAQIDKILVNRFLGIAATGIYATNFFFATLVIIPSRTLIKISTTFIADAWKERNLTNILVVYKKSVINQGIIGLLIFIGLWANIDNIYRVIPGEYAEGRMVILLISIANLIQMLSGVVGTIIGTSRHFRVLTLFVFIFMALIILFSFLLIPIWGITGAALAVAISTLVFSLLRLFFVMVKYKMNPYTLQTIVLLLIAGISYLGSLLIPEMESLVADIIIRSTVILAVYLPAVYLTKISEDVNQIVEDVFTKLRSHLKK